MNALVLLRGQAHVLRSVIAVVPPQLDALPMPSEAPLRAADRAGLGGSETTVDGGT